MERLNNRELTDRALSGIFGDMSSQSYKDDQAVRMMQRCEATVVKDGQRGFCDRPVVDQRTGNCDRPSDHEED